MNVGGHVVRGAVVSTTVGTKPEACELARGLVGDGLAACVQLTPVTSLYRWQGALEETPEILLTIKTTEGGARRLVDAIRERHTYEVPEILVTPVIGGSDAYLEWIDAQVMPTEQP